MKYSTISIALSVHRGWQDYVTLHNMKLLCLAHGGWPNYVTLTGCSNKELLLKGAAGEMKGDAGTFN
jgi:hypothetical protein